MDRTPIDINLSSTDVLAVLVSVTPIVPRRSPRCVNCVVETCAALAGSTDPPVLLLPVPLAVEDAMMKKTAK